MTREEIARVIDPLCFSEAWIGMPSMRAGRQSEALQKADAILAKLHQDAGNGEQGPREQAARQDRLIDSAYAAGLKAGWNLCVSDDGEELNLCIEQRIVGHREAIEKARAADALERGSQVGDGWLLVPREPTEKMKDAHYAAHATSGRVFASAEEVYRAMLAAAPAHGEGE